MSTLTSFHKIGQNRTKTRVWLESRKLANAGFATGTAFSTENYPHRIVLRRNTSGGRAVSGRRIAGSSRPIIELCSQAVSDAFQNYDAIKSRASFGVIEIRPTIRAAAIMRSRSHQGPFRAFELFAGGGTLSDATHASESIRLVGACEIEPSYADAWSEKHPDAELILGDIRLIHPAELPKFDILIAGIPCTSHSTMGRAKKCLAGKPEEGDTGDLFAWVLNIVAHRCPAACVFENVPSFGTSLAGSVLKTGLAQLGYHLHETTIEPHSQWGEPSDRRRWVLLATLIPGFSLTTPSNPERVTARICLDPPNEQDQEDAARIAKTVEGLRRHNARHAALGHGFAFTTINQDTDKIPTIPKSYHKINTGPFVETAYGHRLLRLHEVEAIMGAHAGTTDYSTGIQILGQGVQTRVWTNILAQLAAFLASGPTNETEGITPSAPTSQVQMDWLD